MNRDMEQQILHSESFQNLLKQKKSVIIPLTIFFVSAYFLLPLAVSLAPQWINRPLFHSFTWAWGLAFFQFVMVWIIGMIYAYKSKKWDRLVQQIQHLREDK
ncbi:MAG: DUF485 domain-containing protein [Bacillaceae bacterium]|nr:DUF485 domain-containing protein [Bacillaceae bacterium]